tara:strand:+ start:752 stop:952 length:201 start_codon:yes stop_codon:yes gene_type:complete
MYLNSKLELNKESLSKNIVTPADFDDILSFDTLNLFALTTKTSLLFLLNLIFAFPSFPPSAKNSLP